jgi:hypothetical protein
MGFLSGAQEQGNGSVAIGYRAGTNFQSGFTTLASTIQSVRRDVVDVATIVTTFRHNLVSGQKIRVVCSNANFSAYNATCTVVDPFTFTYPNTGAIVGTTTPTGDIFMRSIHAVAIGTNAGSSNQGGNGIAIGRNAANFDQNANAIAIGVNAARTGQGVSSIAIGTAAGASNQSINSVAIGPSAAAIDQGVSCVAVGVNAGFAGQTSQATAIGPNAGRTSQGGSATAVGNEAGQFSQGGFAVAIGSNAGQNNQGTGSVAIGVLAGTTGQRIEAVAVGGNAGLYNQGQTAVAIGFNAGSTDQAQNAVAVGNGAGYFNQRFSAVAIGWRAGLTNQGTYSIAIGFQAGEGNQGANSIILNASGNTVNTATSGFFVRPVNPGTGTTMVYNGVTREILVQSSSMRYKTNIVDLQRDSSVLYDLRPREFDFTVHQIEHLVGFIAEEVHEIDPSLAIVRSDTGEPESINWSTITTYMVAEMKKLKQQFVALQQENADLRTDLDAVKARLV